MKKEIYKNNAYQELIDNIKYILMNLDSQNNEIKKHIDQFTEEKTRISRLISSYDDNIEENKRKLEFLHNFKSVLKETIKTKVIPRVIFGSLVVALTFLLNINLGVFLTALYLISGIGVYLKETQEIRRKRDTYNEEELEYSINFYNDLKERQLRNIPYLQESQKNLESKLYENNREISKFTDYLIILMYNLSFAKDVSLGRSQEIDRMYAYDTRAKEIEKRVRNKKNI